MYSKWQISHVRVIFYATTVAKNEKVTPVYPVHVAPQGLEQYRIVPNKRAGRVGRKWANRPVQFQWNLLRELVNTYTVCGTNLVKIGWMVPELRPLKLKSSGAHLFKQAHFFGTLWYVKIMWGNRASGASLLVVQKMEITWKFVLLSVYITMMINQHILPN